MHANRNIRHRNSSNSRRPRRRKLDSRREENSTLAATRKQPGKLVRVSLTSERPAAARNPDLSPPQRPAGSFADPCVSCFVSRGESSGRRTVGQSGGQMARSARAWLPVSRVSSSESPVSSLSAVAKVRQVSESSCFCCCCDSEPTPRAANFARLESS